MSAQELCTHRWWYFPTLDTNPELHQRKCVLCGLGEVRTGVTYLSDGSALPATDWQGAADLDTVRHG